jgi:hypothetical protein
MGIMTKEEIIEMAKQCGLIGMRPHLDGIYFEALESFAKLVAEKEREACAKVADEYAEGAERNYSEIIADKIRARGQE